VGHPFCLYLDPADAATRQRPLSGRIGRVVFDCFSPRALARFWSELLVMPKLIEDTPHRVVIAGATTAPREWSWPRDWEQFRRHLWAAVAPCMRIRPLTRSVSASQPNKDLSLMNDANISTQAEGVMHAPRPPRG
jgi:hypothetical protein